MNKALGMIETKGVVGLIDAADAAVKAAKIEIVDYEKATGGFVIIKLRGSVGAVKAAVEAGAAAADRVGQLSGAHVIPNPHSNTELEITPPVELKTFSMKPTLLKSPKEEVKTQPKPKPKSPTPKPKPTAAPKAQASQSEKEKVLWAKAKSEGLDSLEAYELRFLARRLEDFPMEKSKIRVAGKKKLLDAFKNLKI